MPPALIDEGCDVQYWSAEQSERSGEDMQFGNWSRIWLSRLAATACLAMLTTTMAPAANASDWYRLSTQFRGPGWALDVYNGGPKNNQVHLAKVQNVTGQRWRLKLENGYLRLTSDFRGPKMCLDVVNVGARNNFVRLAPCGNFTGQQWFSTPVPNTPYVKFTTTFRGKSMCLDVVNGGADNNDIRLTTCGNYTGQMWKSDALN